MSDLVARGMAKKNSNQIGVLQGIDGHSTVLTKDVNGNVIKVEIKDGETIIQTTNITRDSNGSVLTLTDTLNNKTVTTTINRSNDGSISSVSKEVI